ncbi:hypothetical protein [Acrocarpospora catenulata]|uniref:hypothetical protein n=1 Tax=Acrocarpospora catenulata TaxID=2836182 RepID=UPI001BD9B6B0|nr:hypothetical protein [Acrocarpospora catenulata]
MSHAPYTYATIYMPRGETPQVSISFYTPDLACRAGVLTTGRPYLALRSAEADVCVSTTGAGPVTAADIEIARQIVNAAATYLADCERIHQEQGETGTSGDGTPTTAMPQLTSTPVAVSGEAAA